MSFKHNLTRWLLGVVLLGALSLSAGAQGLPAIQQITNNNLPDINVQLDSGTLVWQGKTSRVVACNDVCTHQNCQKIYSCNADTTASFAIICAFLPPACASFAFCYTTDCSCSSTQNQCDYVNQDEIYLWQNETIARLTDSSQNDTSPALNNGIVAWQASDGHDTEIYLRQNGVVTLITNNDYDDIAPQVANDTVIWSGSDGHDMEIFVWQNGVITRLTDNANDDVAPQIADNRIVWVGFDGHDTEIFLYENGVVTPLTNNDFNDFNPQTAGGLVVWQGSDGQDDEIFLWENGTVRPLTDNAHPDQNPQLADGAVVWQGFDGQDNEIYLWQNNVVTPLTDNAVDDSNPRIDQGIVVWQGYDGTDDEIYAWSNGLRTQITDNAYKDSNPQIQNQLVAWQGQVDKEDDEIFLTQVRTNAPVEITSCTYPALQAALAQSRSLKFACDGTIIVVPELVISQDTVLDATGRNVTLSGNQTNRVLEVNPGVRLELNNITVAKGLTDRGGGIFNAGTLTLINSAVANNSATTSGWKQGGGIFNETGATLTVNHSTLSGNVAGYSGGGISNWGTVIITESTLSNNSAPLQYGYGGGIRNYGGPVTITDSTLSGNTASLYGGGIFSGEGGTVLITNSTLSGNSATVSGGGIFLQQGTVDLDYSTLSNNSGAGSGGLHLYPGNYSAMLTLKHSIVASGISGSNCAGNSVTDNGYNLDSDGTCGLTQPTSRPSTNPLLWPLTNNCGPTQTHALREGSPAIDAIPAAVDGTCAVNQDQRGALRPQDGNWDGVAACDIGAVEQPLGVPAVIEPHGDQVAITNRALEFTVVATDPLCQPLAYAAFDLPNGARFDDVTHVFQWTPTDEQIGDYPVAFEVTNGTYTVTYQVNIAVLPPNEPPVLAPVGDQTVDEGQTLAFGLTATDPDGNPLTYAADNLPAGATLDPNTGAFSWTPDYTQAGTYAVRFTVSDGRASDFEIVTFTVTNVNRPPVLASVGPQSVDENQPLTFTLTATDPDGEPLTFATTTELPPGSRFDPATRTFQWTPDYRQAGVYTVGFSVSDGQLSASEAVSITVHNVNRAPVAQAGPDQRLTATSAAGITITLDGTASVDPDGDALTYTWSGSFGTVDGPTPTVNLPAGAHVIILTVQDSLGATGVATLTIRVSSFALTTTPASQGVRPGQSAVYAVGVTGIEGYTDAISLTVTGLRAGLTASWSRNVSTLAPNNTVLLTVKTGATTPEGNYALTVSGISGAITQTAAISLVVTTAPLAADFSLTATPSTLSVMQGAARLSTQLDVIAINGLTAQVDLSIAGLPADAAAFSADGRSTYPVPSYIAQLNLNLQPTTPTGTHPLTVTGTAGALSHATGVTLNVLAPPPPGSPNTPASDGPIAVPTGNGVTVQYTGVTATGSTTATVSENPPPPPTGFKVAGQTYEITTGADVVGTITVYIEYPENPNDDPDEFIEKQYRLMHYDGTAWRNITSPGYPDTATNLIAGQVTHFSLFSVMEEQDPDGDGILGQADNCPDVANPDQADRDGDGIGDICDPDDDNDGVADNADVCSGTPAGTVVDPLLGCSIAQSCPCSGPRGSTESWRNHGQYVSCVATTAESFVSQQLISTTERDTIVSAAAKSSCGKKN